MEDQEDGMRFSVCNLLTNDNCIDLRLGPGVSRPRLSDEARVSNTTKTYITGMQFLARFEYNKYHQNLYHQQFLSTFGC